MAETKDTSFVVNVKTFFLSPPVAIGALLMAGLAGLIVAKLEADAWCAGLVHDAGITVLSAGAFTAITKSFVFVGIFGDAVRKFFDSEAFSRKLEAILESHESHADYCESAWTRRTNSLLKARVTNETHVKAAISRLSGRLGVPVSGLSRGFYANIQVNYTVTWVDRENGVIQIQDHQTMTLVPPSNGDKLEIFSQSSGDPTHAKMVVNECRVNKTPLKPTRRIADDGRTVDEFQATLVGEDSYEVYRDTTRQECIYVEPYVHSEFLRHVVRLDVYVTQAAPGLHCKVLPIGEHTFLDHLAKTEPTGQQHYTAAHVLPGEGYVLLFVLDPPSKKQRIGDSA